MKLRSLLLSWILMSTLLSGPLTSAAPIVIPQTSQEVELFAGEAFTDLEKAQQALSKSPKDTTASHRLVEDCVVKTSILESLTFSIIPIPQQVKDLAAKYVVQLKERCKVFLGVVPKFSVARPLFTCVNGAAPFKVLPADRKVTVLSWNICCFSGGLPMLYGGVRPWPERMEGIVREILDLNSDIVCLQEVFSEEAIHALYKRLKEKYAFFYLNIGPREYSFDPEKLGKLSSGLFVASKYLLEDPSFYPYDLSKGETELVRRYGIFMANLSDRLCVCTTHLQPGDDKRDRNIRSNQLKAIQERASKILPTCIFADLNIEYGGDEYERVVVPSFTNHYKWAKNKWTCCELRDAWFNSEKYAKALSQGTLPLEWIDAVLEIKHKNRQTLEVKCEVIPIIRLEDPKNALSDHRPLFSTITLPKQRK